MRHSAAVARTMAYLSPGQGGASASNRCPPQKCGCDHTGRFARP
jgi:hypothetical protein